ncbi:hypothetical protein [Phenylobacterium sp.]|uniref:hypothetical protein n=1 Tax=Phenylobacterium sp. TaxID=1871053 RepID=UPI0030F49A5B
MPVSSQHDDQVADRLGNDQVRVAATDRQNVGRHIGIADIGAFPEAVRPHDGCGLTDLQPVDQTLHLGQGFRFTAG